MGGNVLGAKNKVIAGDYEGKLVTGVLGRVNISTGLFKSLPITKDIIEDYEVMDEEKRMKATSAVGRGLVGGFLLGPVGLLAGLSAKKKGVYIVALQFRDGKKSLLEVDEKIYKILLKSLF